ncbi:MAG: hypothetical protein V2G48_01790 [bacterium JZ-2024 1]
MKNHSEWWKYLLIGCGGALVLIIVFIFLLVGCGIWAIREFKKTSYAPPPSVEMASSVTYPTVVDLLIGRPYDEHEIAKLGQVTLTEGEINFHLQRVRKEALEELFRENSVIEDCEMLMSIETNQMSVYVAVKLSEELKGEIPGFFRGLRLSFLFEGIQKQVRDRKLFLNVENVRVGTHSPAPMGEGTLPEKHFTPTLLKLPGFVTALAENRWELPPVVKDIKLMEKKILLTFHGYKK